MPKGRVIKVKFESNRASGKNVNTRVVLSKAGQKKLKANNPKG